MSVAWDDDQYLAGVVADLGQGAAKQVETLERIRAVYVECGRDIVMRQQFDRFLRMILAKKPSGERVEGAAFFVTGESGAGKTLAVEHLVANTKALQPRQAPFGPVKPIISVSLIGPITLKILGRNILRAAGYPVEQQNGQGDVWDMLPMQLHHRKVLMVHIDETQHMVKKTEKDHERMAVANAIKGVMNYKPWPVSFLLSGKPETIDLAAFDEQIERRHVPIALGDVIFPAERELVEKIVREMAAAVPIEVGRSLDGDLPLRIAHSAKYRYGRIAQVVYAALEIATERGDAALTKEHFAHAFVGRSQARGKKDKNPFLVANLVDVEPGSFFDRPERFR